MAETIVNAMPCRITAGDTLAVRLAASGYLPGDGWSAAIVAMIPGAAEAVDFAEPTVDGDSWVFEEDTSEWVAGSYVWQLRVTKDTEVHTVDQGDFEVVPALAAGVDTRTHEEKCLAAIKAYLAGNVSAPMAEHRVGDSTGYRMVREWSHADLLKLQAYYQRLVDRQKGKGLGIRTIPVRFARV